jgi:hypothetical protein
MKQFRQLTIVARVATVVVTAAMAMRIEPAHAVPGWLIDYTSGTSPNDIIHLLQLPPDEIARSAPYAPYMYGSVIRAPVSKITVNGSRVTLPLSGSSRTYGFAGTRSCGFFAHLVHPECGQF